MHSTYGSHTNGVALNGTQPDAEFQMLANLPAMAFASRPDGSWNYVNPAFCTYTGSNAEALTGLGWAAFVFADDRAMMLRQWQSSIRSGSPFVSEHRLCAADGSYRWQRTEASPQHNALGVCIRWVGITTPLADDPLLAAKRAPDLAAESHQDVSDGILAIAAHELRGPLTVLLGQARLLQRRMNARTGGNPSDRRAVDLLVDQTLRLNALTHVLLDVAQIDHGYLRVTLTALDLSELVQRVVRELQPTFPNHILRLRNDTEGLSVMGDALRLEQVLQNLIQNAVKYSPDGIEVLITLFAHREQAVITVRDHGQGISAEAQPHLFQRFFRVKSNNGNVLSGLGIGLYVCKALMDLHNGRIEVESVEKEGSTFTLILPQM
ncbi:MAG: PAS domain-containing protein [Candidatus Viridilinea halotolerans]|uniref:histidine kinase n=1 Tax=Candidatus Viridilinea halotolerans TaxID=2491704 RepID=A0A426TWU6_9CHLR|nr:MAG: PAS domain-containing protein [Candidatus Viridilinea halotolerans]